MTDENKMPEPVPSEIVKEEGDPAPELKVVPIEDLDKIEKLLDVALNTVQTPNLPNIKAACMQELKEIDDALSVQIQAAQEEYRVALAEHDAKRIAKAAEAQKKVDEENRKRDKAARERGYPDTIAGSPRDTLAYPRDPTGPSTVYPSDRPVYHEDRDPPPAPKNGIERRI